MTSAVIDQVFEPVTQCLTPEVAQRIAALRASPEVQARLDELADKCGEGSLSETERDEYEWLVRAVNFVGVLQAKARSFLLTSGM